jgi:hypothetical protein
MLAFPDAASLKSKLIGTQLSRPYAKKGLGLVSAATTATSTIFLLVVGVLEVFA